MKEIILRDAKMCAYAAGNVEHFKYLLIVNNDIKSVVDLVDFIGEQEEKIQQIEDRQKEIYRESSSRKRSIKNEEQYREYQIWHMEVQEELDEIKQKKRGIKRQIQLADDIIKEDLYTAYYACRGMRRLLLTGMLRYRGWKRILRLIKQRQQSLSLMQMLR